MRILLLITDLELGGTPTVVRELAIRLRKSGDDVEVACLSRWGPVADQLTNAGVSVTAFNADGPRDAEIPGRLIRLIREKKFNTVFSFLMHANAMAAAASLRIPNVRWIQSIQTTQPLPRWHWWVQRLAQHRAERIVVPSGSVAQVARSRAGVADEKIIVIPNAIDLADWSAAQSPVSQENPRPYPITFLGRLDPIKNVPGLVAAAAGAGDVHLHIFGEGEDREVIERTIRDTGVHATMHGAIDSPQAALSRSGMLILPSFAEGFGLVLIEAMAAGVPVVASDIPGIRDVVRNGETGLLVSPGLPGPTSQAIRNLVEDPALRQRLISAAKKDVVERFTWDAVLPRYKQLLGI
jgi:glycosyltransferase involved in cell wall biosynthesis